MRASLAARPIPRKSAKNDRGICKLCAAGYDGIHDKPFCRRGPPGNYRTMRLVLPALLLLAACSSGDEDQDKEAAGEAAAIEEPQVTGDKAISPKIEQDAKSIEKAAAEAAALVEADAKEEIRASRPKANDLENEPQN